LTVEGANDDISAPGQTYAVHDWLTGLQPWQHEHLLQPGVGHYGLFSGNTWRTEIAPRFEGFIRTAAARQGIEYDPIEKRRPRRRRF
jgi:poly(3-hydroxybutyrate) depolymerase